MTSRINLLLTLMLFLSFTACKKNESNNIQEEKEELVPEDISSFKETAILKLGAATAAEISAYDAETKRLFVVSNDGGTKVEIVDFKTFPTISKIETLLFPNNAGVNSVSVYNGLLAIALDGTNKQANGEVVIINTTTLKEIKRLTVGAMPDMITFSPDGNYILTANEGEPNETYTVDPLGSISIIDVKNNYQVKTLDFKNFESSKQKLVSEGFRIFGSNASFAQDIEPEYITVLPDSKTAYATLQENNGLAEIDIISGKITKIIPLGIVDHSLTSNPVDFTVKNGQPNFQNWPVKSFFLPDAIANFSNGGKNYLVLANEGDTRDWTKETSEEIKVGKLKLDPTKFPNASSLQSKDNLADLLVSKYYGDTDVDGDYDELYAFGTRSFSIVDPKSGELIANISRELAEKAAAAGKYDVSRAPKKGVEVEGVTIGKVNGKNLAFIGLERSDLIAVYDLTNPSKPSFVQSFETGDAPEGLLFIAAKNSPNGRSMLIVSNEDDGTIRCYQPNKI